MQIFIFPKFWFYHKMIKYEYGKYLLTIAAEMQNFQFDKRLEPICLDISRRVLASASSGVYLFVCLFMFCVRNVL